MSQTPNQTAGARFQNDNEFRAKVRQLELRDEIWEALVGRFRECERDHGLTQSVWAQSMGKTPGQASRMLRGPSNLTTDTIALAFSALDSYLKVEVVPANVMGGNSYVEYCDDIAFSDEGADIIVSISPPNKAPQKWNFDIKTSVNVKFAEEVEFS